VEKKKIPPALILLVFTLKGLAVVADEAKKKQENWINHRLVYCSGLFA